MRDALLRDLSALPYKIRTTVDARLAPPMLVPDAMVINETDDVWQMWKQQIRAADAVWLIAPETDDLLRKLTESAVEQQKIIIGCGSRSIQITSSKLATYQVLQQAGIATIPTFTLENWPKNAGEWLAKPDDGAGCDETFFFRNANDLATWISSWNKARSYIAQPFQAGIPASISCVIHRGRAHILSCNSQIITIKNNQLKFGGIIVNGMREYWTQFEMVANKVAQIMPDLAGYVGIDVIVNNDEVIVVEINPRLTTSYCGLIEATGANPAELIMNTLTHENYRWPELEQNVIELHV